MTWEMAAMKLLNSIPLFKIGEITPEDFLAIMLDVLEEHGILQGEKDAEKTTD